MQKAVSDDAPAVKPKTNQKVNSKNIPEPRGTSPVNKGPAAHQEVPPQQTKALKGSLNIQEPPGNKPTDPSGDSGFMGFVGARSRSGSPSPHPDRSSVTGKFFGLGSSLLSSASDLISSTGQDEPFTTPPPTSRKGSGVSQVSNGSALRTLPVSTPGASRKGSEAAQSPQTCLQAEETKPSSAGETDGSRALPEVCPVCGTTIRKEPPDYNTCTQCRSVVCNLCGFDPTPHDTTVSKHT